MSESNLMMMVVMVVVVVLVGADVGVVDCELHDERENDMEKNENE